MFVWLDGCNRRRIDTKKDDDDGNIWNMVEEFGGNFETAISVIIIAKRARGCTLDSLFFSYVGANALRLKQGNLLIADGQSCWVANSYGHD